MNKHLARLISDYQASVRTAVEFMQRSGIPLPSTSRDWVKTDIPNRGELEGEIQYYKHGYGCAVSLSTGKVDFDFGRHGVIGGFDAWRLAGFADSKLPEYGFATEDALKTCFKEEVAAGSLVYSGYILYYLADTARSPSVEACKDSTPQLEIESASYDEFLDLWEQGAFDQQRLGQAFYNHFRLHQLTDQAVLRGLYEADAKKASAVISRIFQIR